MKHSTYLLSILILVSLMTPSILSSPIVQSNTNPYYPNHQNLTTDEKINEIIQLINETVITTFLEELVSIGPRMTGTYGCQKAGGYIFDSFREFGLQATAHYWEGYGNRWHPGFYQSHNIEGVHPAATPVNDEVIIFNAHYDTVEDTVGANDDGSGVVGVLAAAYALSQFPFDRTIKFVTFSGEEIGLLGSTAYAKQLYEQDEQVLVEFNADMIGKANTTEQGCSMRLSFSEDTQWIIDGINTITHSFGELNMEITGTYPYDRDSKHGGSDYYPFIRYGYESIAFWQATWDPNMHTPQDDLSNVNISYLVNTSRLIASTIAYCADETVRPLTVEITSPKKGRMYRNDRIIHEFSDEKTMVFNDVWIYTDIETFDASVEKVEFYVDGVLQETVYDIPYVWHYNQRSLGKQKITVVAHDDKGRTSTDQVSFLYVNPRLAK